MRDLVKKVANNKNGITLMALVVTIIILLILAGISIGMLSGDNSIINQAGNAKTQTDIAGEKEILEQATVVCMGKNKYGNIEEIDLKKELENVADVTLSGNKFKVTFPSERQYLIDQDGNVKEKNPNVLEISELYEGASRYFGWDVINYAETLPEELQDTEWQLFYAGALDGETEERIYLISKEYVKNTDLPAKNGATPIATDGSDYKACFGTNISTGIMSQYSGSIDVLSSLQKYNKKYYVFLNGDTSTNNNMKAIAYMLDISIWNSFATSSQNYAEWAIGGPTIELLFKAYNKYKGTEYETQVIDKKGYEMRKTSTDSFTRILSNTIANQIDSPYSVYTLSYQASGYWIASPPKANTSRMLNVDFLGDIEGNDYFTDTEQGFRPIILLNSNYTLEKTKDSNRNDAFKIVEQ